MYINRLKYCDFHRLLTVVVSLFFLTAYAQQSEFNTLYNKTFENIFSIAAGTGNVLTYLNDNAKGYEQKTRVAILYSDYYLSRGEYEKSIESIFKAGENIRHIPDSLKLEIVLRKAHLVQSLKLYSQFRNYELQADRILKNGDRNRLTGRFIKSEYEKASVLISRDSLKAALEITDKAYKEYLAADLKDNDLFAQYAILKALVNPGGQEVMRDLTVALDNYKSGKKYNRLLKATVMMLYSDGLRKNDKHQEALSVLLAAERETTAFQNPYLENKIYGRLSTYFTGIISPELQLSYNDKFVSTYNKIHDNEITALNSFYKQYKTELENSFEASKSKYIIYNFIIGGVILLVVITFCTMYAYTRLKAKKLTEIISYLEIPNKLLEKKPAPLKSIQVKEKEKRINMPDDTERMILEKLISFEQSDKFTNPNMSLAFLAGEIDVNTKYLSEVINNHYNDNYNTYINKLRVNYIIEKLKNDPNYLNYKISYLAEESGFSSHSSFTTVFRNIAGISPTEFIQVMSKQIQQKA